MLATLQALFNALRATATYEARSLSRMLIFLIATAYSLSFAQSIFGQLSDEAVFIFGIIIIALNIYQIFRIRRLISVTAIGETLELARVLPTQAGVISNKLIDVYWQVAVSLAAIISVFCLTTPFMPLWRYWWLPTVWPTIFIFLGIVFGSFSKGFFKLILAVEIIAFTLIAFSMMFPQMKAHSQFGRLSEMIMPSDIADNVNSIDNLRKSQRDDEIRRNLEEVSTWVKKNPNTEYPKDYQFFLESQRIGGRKTLNEVRFEILHPRASTPTAKKTGWQKVEEKVVDFSQVELMPFNQKKGVPTIPIKINLTEETRYRLKISGGWEFFMSNNSWTKFPWEGNNSLAGRPEFRPEEKMNFGSIIILNNGENITPVDKEGIILNLGKNSNFSLRINVLLRKDEFFKNGKSIRNSMDNPTKITIEKEV